VLVRSLLHAPVNPGHAAALDGLELVCQVADSLVLFWRQTRRSSTASSVHVLVRCLISID
jgi:hypothetical protein